MPEFTVRYAKKSELERVNEIRYQVNRVHSNGRPDIFRDDFCDEMKNIVYKVFDGENSDVIVAVNGDTICGFATVEYIVKEKSPYGLQRKFYRIAEFGVDENFRRMGVATKLINFCKQEAKNRGFDRLELDVWEFNEGANEVLRFRRIQNLQRIQGNEYLNRKNPYEDCSIRILFCVSNFIYRHLKVTSP